MILSNCITKVNNKVINYIKKVPKITYINHCFELIISFLDSFHTFFTP